MLSIGQLASYAGVTVRAVRHYHATGLLPEPERDHSGYRRYDAAAVVDLVRIRTLADAGVPLSRVRELLVADEAEFTATLEEVDRRLCAEIRARQEHRRRVARLAAGDSLALPTEVVAYLDRLRELGFRERLVEVERDSWILIAAQMPHVVATLMAIKRAQIEDERVRAFYRELEELVDCEPDDPRLPGLADRLALFMEQAESVVDVDPGEVPEMSEALITLLDTALLESVPSAARLLELLEERGWVGWTDIRRIASC